MEEVDEKAGKPPKNMDIVGRFAAFQRAIGMRNQCPFCNTDKWDVLAPPDGQPVASSIQIETVPFGSDEGDSPPTFRLSSPAIYMTCRTCRFVRMHTLDGMLEWEKLQQAGGQDAER